MPFFSVLVDAYHKEQLYTRKEAEISAYVREWRWGSVAVTKDGDTIARIADILEKYGFNDDARYIRTRGIYVCTLHLYLQLLYLTPSKRHNLLKISIIEYMLQTSHLFSV